MDYGNSKINFMWKYIISWGLFVHGIVNYGPIANIGQHGFEKIGSDSSVFFNRDSAVAFKNKLEADYLRPPKAPGRARALFIEMDSIFIEQPKRKRFLFFKL